MIIIGTISFLLGVFSMLISLYIYSLGKRDIKGLRYFEIWKKNRKSYFVIFNSSELYITKNDIYKNISINLRDKNSILHYYKIIKPFNKSDKSDVNFCKEGNEISLCINYIYPKSYAILEIKSNSKKYFSLDGIIENGKIIKYNYPKIRFLYHSITNFVIGIFVTELLFLSILLPLVFFEKLDDTQANIVGGISIISSVIIAIFFEEKISPFWGFSKEIIDDINKIIKKEERDFKKKRFKTYVKYLRRVIKINISKNNRIIKSLIISIKKRFD